MVSENFLLPHYLLNWLQVLHAVKRPKQRIISFYGSEMKKQKGSDPKK